MAPKNSPIREAQKATKAAAGRPARLKIQMLKAEAPDRRIKTRFISGSQCHLRLWNDTHARELASKPSSTLQAIFDTGRIVGELACERHPGGRLIAQDYRHTDEALKETARALEDETCPALFEAAFVHQGVLARADIIERLPEGGWRLIEVKSGTRAKDVFVQDLAVQFWVLVGAGLNVREAGVLTLNRDYVYDGEHMDLQGLFRFHPLMQEVERLQDSLNSQVASMLTTLEADDAPNIPPGDHCFVPYHCPYHDHCARNLVTPKYPIGEIPRLSVGELEQLQLSNIVEASKIPDSFPLNNLQSVVRESIKESRHIVHGDVQGALARLTPPIHHLDFETFAPAIPRFAGTRPFDAIPFLFSIRQKPRTRPDRCNQLSRRLTSDFLHFGTMAKSASATPGFRSFRSIAESLCYFVGQAMDIEHMFEDRPPSEDSLDEALVDMRT